MAITEAIIGLLSILLVAAFYAAIGAVFLRIAVAICNRYLAGSKAPTAAPYPSYFYAVGITYLMILASLVIYVAVALTLGGGSLEVAFDQKRETILIVSLLLCLPAVIGILRYLLPTTVLRALVVVLGMLLLIVLLMMVVGLLIFIGLALLPKP